MGTGTAKWNTPQSASWTVQAPATTGDYTLDVEVWSDNLGTAVDDPTDPYHKFEVSVQSHWHRYAYALLEYFARLFTYRSYMFVRH